LMNLFPYLSIAIQIQQSFFWTNTGMHFIYFDHFYLLTISAKFDYFFTKALYPI
jgi:hypothetical protein